MTDLERGPSSDGESAICASSLNNSPDPHSIVERLREPCDGWSGDAWAVGADVAEEGAAEIERLRRVLEASDSNHHSMAKLLAEIGERARAAESSLSRIQSETVEACAKIAEEHTWTLPLYAPEENINVAVGEAANIVIGQVASAIRSSLTNGGSGAEKTAESEHSPSTQNTRTE